MPIVGGIRFGPKLSGIGAVRWNGQSDRVLGRQPALRSGQRAKYPRAMDFLLDAMML
jgi:hypothetical protein